MVTKRRVLCDTILHDRAGRTVESGRGRFKACRIAACIDPESIPSLADIVLMEEWLSIGDQEFAQKAQARLGAVLDQATILFLASHDEALIRKNCNWLLRLQHGKMVALERIRQSS